MIPRIVPAMAAATAGYLTVFLTIHSWLRQHYLAPLVRLRHFGTPPGLRGTDWQLDSPLIDRSGAILSPAQIQRICPSNDSQAFTNCLQANGILQRQTYQPANRFWPFQDIELSIFLTLTFVLVGFTLWWTRTRVQ